MKIIYILVSILVCSIAQCDITVSVLANPGAGAYVEEDTSLLPDNSLLLAGFLDLDAYNLLSVTEQATFTAIDPIFNDVAQFTSSSGNYLGSTNVNQGLATTGDQMYVWVFNANTGIAASEMGIFTSDSWSWVNDTGTVNLSTALLDASGVILGGQDGINYTLVAAVPEPSTYALIFGVFSLAIVFWQRRRR